jgi:TonB family protein
MTQRAFPVAILGLGSFLATAPLSPLLASPPEPLNKETWIKPDDYPSRAARDEQEGAVRFSVRVSSNGRVEDCSIVSSSGYDDLDETTCKLVARRARFKPALDENGSEVVSYYSNSVRWTLGRDEASERPQFADANQYSNESQRGDDPQSFASPQASQAEAQPNPLNEAAAHQQAQAQEPPEQLATEQEPDSATESPDEEVTPSHDEGGGRHG